LSQRKCISCDETDLPAFIKGSNKCKKCKNKSDGARRTLLRQQARQYLLLRGEQAPEVQHIEEAVGLPPPRQLAIPPRASTVILGDIHFPWHNLHALTLALRVVYELQPDNVVQIGDLYDLYSFSKYPRSLNLMTPEAELLAGRAAAEEMWKAVHKASPASKCWQLWGNHDSRVQRRTLEKLPVMETFVAMRMRDLMTFEGVTTTDSQNKELILDGIHYIHGHLSKVGDHVRETRVCTVAGDLHVGGSHYIGYEGSVHWELRVGWLGDWRAPVYSYHGRKRAHKTTLGVGVVDAFGPRFIEFVETL
jgi:hypothetical protein